MIAVQSSVSIEMLRLCLLGVLFILFADGVNSSDSIRNVTANEGSFFGIFVVSEPNHNAKTCILKSPQDKIFEFTPHDVGATTEKYHIYEDLWVDCMVSVHNIDINDEGIWVLTYDHELEDGASSASVNLAVVVTEPEYKEVEDITVLSMIDHFTRIGLLIDISLDKRSFEEECYVQPPNGILTKAENFDMENVIVQRSSNFVSCRITLGPMSESLLGNWRLCGKSTQTDEMRCQPANVVWNNNNHPNADWGSLIQTMFSHPVHFGGSVNPGVASTGTVVTCNVITPNGEDLVITSDVNYPHIERIAFDRQHLCSINFTNIDRTSIGEWTIYGKFRSAVSGLHEIHQPLKFFLYNEEQPYDQAYNVTTLSETRYPVILGRTLEVNVQSVGQVENCQYRMPTGQSYNLNNVIAPNGVVLKGVDTPTCRITLSPITKDMLGEWQLIGKFSNGNQFTERRQTFHIIQEDPSNPILDDFRVVENLTETILDTKLGASHRVTITTESRVENESCHLMTPNGLQYAFIDGFHIPNVEIIKENGVECGVKVDVLDLDMLGEWILIARATRSSNPIERRRRFTIRVEDGVDSSGPSRNITANEGSFFGIFVVAEPNHNAKTCILKSPQNKIFEFTPHDVGATTEKYHIHEDLWIDCMVSVHNIDINDEGIWVLTYDHELPNGASSESVNLTVVVTEPEYNEVEDITVLSMIDHFTRIGLSIDISLDKRSFEEECYVQPPNGVLTKAENFNMENVIVQTSSNFVSCRITLGPMSESLLGNWRLCGKSTQTDEMRCQPANVVWNNNNHPNAEWGSLIQTMFNHPVHFGGSVNPGVASTGTVVTCNVITPNGEDLVITSDVNYPHIERIAFDRQHLCSINFTNIDRSLIGEWTIYGKFRSAINGLHEIHAPLKFFLYNEEQPYDQAYNVTTLPDDKYLVILGRTLEISVNSVAGQVENCQYRMPTGQSYDLNNVIAPNGVVLKGTDTTPACRITLSPITQDMLGEWQLIGKFSNGNQFTERRQTINIIQEDPASPILDDFRVVENLTETILDTKLGASHRVTITTESRVENESCHLMTPNGLQYAFIDGFHIPNVEILEENGIECGVKVDVLDLDMLGEWILIARATRSSNPIERRRRFIIGIEETSSLGDAITISEGADLYLSLPNATDMYDTCKLYANEEEVTDFEVDQFRYSSCGYIVRNVTHAQHGSWAIVYGNQIIYRATVEVNILELVEISVENMVWAVGSSVNVTLGPEDAVYCRLIDFNGNYVYDGFGPCRVVVDRVTEAHQGWWSISVGVSGTVMLRQDKFYVDVTSTDSRPVVTTDVARNGSSVIMTCSVPGENEVHACLFRDPSGNVFIASHGVGQDGYSGAVIRYESDSDSHICTLRLLAPSSEDQGIWRCAVNTARDISFAFLTVTGSIMDQTTNYYYNEPELKSAASIFGGEEGNAVSMSCSIDTAVRYCYFRAPNGTVYNVGPYISSTDYEYVGNGFDAGECGIRFTNLLRNDSGSWSCNVGVVHNHEELSRAFEVSVYVHVGRYCVLINQRCSGGEYCNGVRYKNKSSFDGPLKSCLKKPMTMYHGWHGRSVSLRLQIGGAPVLEYCRFVRIDGLGFTSDNVPFEYDFDSHELSTGACALKIPSPVSQDLDPWTVFAKTIATEAELSMTSTFILPPPLLSGTMLIIPILMWTLFALVCLLLILAAVSLVPKKNREWTYQRASIIRNSFKKQKPRPVLTDMLY